MFYLAHPVSPTRFPWHNFRVNFFFEITGTGKTKTLVAAIEQIVRTTDQNVLVCASSNAACDEIAVRLLKVPLLFQNILLSRKRH